MHSTSSRLFNRRSALIRAAVGTTVLASSGVLLAACGGSADVTEATRTARQLESLSLAASDDAVAARTLIARNPDRAAALAVIANERQAHATILNDEIARLAPDIARPSTNSGVAPAPTTKSTRSPGSTESSAPVAPTVTTVDELRTRLRSATTTTGDLAVAMSGYRSGMLGSIAAALNAQVQVQLA